MNVYLDNHSTTPVDPRVVEALKPFFFEHFGNPASVHALGENAKQAIEVAREQVASVIKAEPDQIYFTPSATIANNIILRGRLTKHRKDHGSLTDMVIITTNTEHSSISKTLQYLQNTHFHNPQIKINAKGELDLNDLDKVLSNYFLENKVLVSIIGANNEIGTIHNLKAIGEICKKNYVAFHTDATQAIGKVDIDVNEMNISALTLSGHKIYGPKGIGCMYIKDPDLIEPLIHGGYQDIFTSGTQNVFGIVGLGKACEILQQEGPEENKRMGQLRDLLWQQLSAGLPDIFINGIMGKNRLTNNLNITIKDIEAEVLVKGMEDVIISSGSACESGSIDPSHVIKALGTPYPECAFRFGLGRFTTKEEIIYAANRIIEIVNGVRSVQ